MTPRYQKGQQVIIRAADDAASRESVLAGYEGHEGKVIDYYWIDAGGSGHVFYVYQVKMTSDSAVVVLHEDELEAAY